jgi:phenylpropionate dioxygenase-like ring-hydroxylating dioxygenase large terminal subunit
MYINFWYPITRSEDLAYDQPERVKVLGVELVVFRDTNGDAHVLSDTCVHRGASLGGAWSGLSAPRIVNGCIVCPYHGWEFDGDGQCQNIPSVGYGTKTPPRAKVDSYPVQEKYGIVFAFLGDLDEEERPSLLNVEEYGQDGWRANSVLIIEVDYNYERSMENGLDPAHNEFVHPTHGFSGKYRETYKVRDYATEDHEQGWGFWFRCAMDTPPLPQADHQTANGGTPWGDAKTDRSKLTSAGGTYGPNAMSTYINLGPGKMFRQYFFEQPVTENKTRIFFLNMRNFIMDPDKDGPIHARNKIIAQQDINILSTMNPQRPPMSNTKEIMVPADKAILTYRDWLRKFDSKGWRIDINEFNRRNGKVEAFTIPSPGRKTSANWVLDTIPLIKGQADQKLESVG